MQATGSGSSTRQVASGPPVASDVLTVGAAPHAEDIGLDPVGAEHRVRRFASFVSAARRGAVGTAVPSQPHRTDPRDRAPIPDSVV